jgi:hypothetical protein
MWIKVSFGVLFLLVINVAVLKAQNPSTICDGTDPDASCPLDTWVIFLAAAAFVFAAVKLYRKRSAQEQYLADSCQD